MTPTTLRAARTAARLTQREAAALMGVTVRMLKSYEAGDAPIPEARARLLRLELEARAGPTTG